MNRYLKDKLDALKNFTDGCREDMRLTFRTDGNDVSAHVIGDHLDNAFGESINGDQLEKGYHEYVVVLHKGMDNMKINLATLIALARKADLKDEKEESWTEELDALNEEKEMDFETSLTKFMSIAQDGVDVDMKRFPGQFKRLSLMRGKRYIRIVAESGMEHVSYKNGEVTTQRSAWGFIDTTNGDILKAASWKTPAKHARGNIFNEKYHLTPYGPPYLK